MKKTIATTPNEPSLEVALTQAEIDARLLEENLELESSARRGVLKQIETLEAEITPRRLREAVLTPEGATWLQAKEDEIQVLRLQLV